MRVKICGLRTEADIDAAVRAGATAVGFEFSPGPRAVPLSSARALIDRVPRGVEAVAVFREPDPDGLARVLDLGVDGVQSEFEPTGAQRAGVFWLRVVRGGPDLLDRLGAPSKGTLVSGSLRGCVLVDGVARGGASDAERDRVLAACELHPVVISGGLTWQNVGGWIGDVRPVGVDVNSGVESTTAVKDAALIQAFVKEVRTASR